MVSILLCIKSTNPPLERSRSTHSLTISSDQLDTSVTTSLRPTGGVSILDTSLIPTRLMYSVRGIGVAVSVRVSTSAFLRRMRSFCLTPKRCSSSTTRSPRSFHFTASASNAWVPISTSTLPSANSANVFLRSASPTKRESIWTLIGSSFKRSVNVR
ncbi:hypothetical protein ES703_48399 [subsurface metagenome]